MRCFTPVIRLQQGGAILASAVALSLDEFTVLGRQRDALRHRNLARLLRHAMHISAEKNPWILAQTHGWSAARAQGFVEGEAARRRGEKPSSYRLVGIDDYALGFRAGYFLRAASRPAAGAIGDAPSAMEQTFGSADHSAGKRVSSPDSAISAARSKAFALLCVS
jgi:hypothetical protein